jgi:hypothetical protein
VLAVQRKLDLNPETSPSKHVAVALSLLPHSQEPLKVARNKIEPQVNRWVASEVAGVHFELSFEFRGWPNLSANDLEAVATSSVMPL